MKNNKRTTFVLPEEITLTQTITSILESNGQKETPQERTSKIQQDKETKLIIIRDAAAALAQKKIPEKNIVELLVKHLEAKKHIAENIIKDIKEKLIPFAKIIDSEKEAEAKKQEEKRQREKKESEEAQNNTTEEIEAKKKEEFKKAKEELLKKIGAKTSAPKPEPEAKPNLPYSKKIEIKSVEENAKQMTNEGKNITTKESAGLPQKDAVPQEPQKKPDAYQEPIE